MKPPAGAAAPAERWLALVAAHLAAGTFDKLVLARWRGAPADAQRIVARPVLLRGERQLSFTTRHATRDTVKNLPPAAAIDALRDALGGSFGHAHLFAAGEEAQLLIGKKGTATLRRTALAGPATAPPERRESAAPTGEPIEGAVERTGETGVEKSVEGTPGGLGGALADSFAAAVPSHDRAKRRWVDIEAPFLVALGVTDDAHRLVPAMARKWKQINRFVEVFDHALASSALDGAARVRVADYGAGKGYLTFAVHDHLRRCPGAAPEVVGVEWRDDLVRLGNDAAARLGLRGLSFVQGDVGTHALESVDVMIALHACDTATDHAIHRGIRAGAAVIMTSPCCHKELRPQLRAPAVLRPVLRHGVHLGQQAEMLTDGLRALLLEAEGYDTQVFEFVSLEHTQKNKMILAVKRREPASRAAAAAERRQRIGAQIAALMAHYDIREQRLERLLRTDADAAAAV